MLYIYSLMIRTTSTLYRLSANTFKSILTAIGVRVLYKGCGASSNIFMPTPEKRINFKITGDQYGGESYDSACIF
jgi:hypothetical protein